MVRDDNVAATKNTVTNVNCVGAGNMHLITKIHVIADYQIRVIIDPGKKGNSL